MAAKVDTVRLSVRPVARVSRTKGTRNNILFYVGYYIGADLGWSASARVNLFWGEGKDEGWCRIEVAHDGRLKIKQGGKRTIGSFFFKTHQYPKNGGCVGGAAEVKFVVTPDKALLVKMPPWFYRTHEKKHPNDTHRGRPLAPQAAPQRTGQANGHAIPAE